MIDAVETHSFLVDRFDDPPRRLWDVRVFVLGLRVPLPARCALRFCDSDPNVNAPQGSGGGDVAV
jgi:hypothetical protein